MKKIQLLRRFIMVLTFPLGCLFQNELNAQSLEGGNINTNSANISNGSIELDFTIGSLVSGEMNANILSLYHLIFPLDGLVTAIDQRFINYHYLKLYPNPLSHRLNIDTDLTDIGNIIILDNSQRVLQNITRWQGQQIDFSHHSSGIYLMLILSSNGDLITTHRIIKR